jgi:hypothetical protein
MTDLGTKYNEYVLVSWTIVADNGSMKNFQNFQNLQNPHNTQAALRAAFGPGFQAGGPSDKTLRVIAKQPKS